MSVASASASLQPDNLIALQPYYNFVAVHFFILFYPYHLITFFTFFTFFTFLYLLYPFYPLYRLHRLHRLTVFAVFTVFNVFAFFTPFTFTFTFTFTLLSPGRDGKNATPPKRKRARKGTSQEHEVDSPNWGQWSSIWSLFFVFSNFNTIIQSNLYIKTYSAARAVD